MLKSYLEYALTSTFGAITTEPCNVLFDKTGTCAFTGCLEAVKQWNIRQGVAVSTLKEDSKKKSPQATVLCLSPDKVHLAAG